MRITFSPHQNWEIDRSSIVYYANAYGRQIRCVIPQEFLTTPRVERLNEEEARQLFSERRDEIELLFRDEIEARGYECPDEIILRI